ncbi:MAG TPA: metallophosphoesterase [Bacteroides reticulotermitis]|nr:metallophosphoesterase [Bacteroides reticulotermitis]
MKKTVYLLNVCMALCLLVSCKSKKQLVATPTAAFWTIEHVSGDSVTISRHSGPTDTLPLVDSVYVEPKLVSKEKQTVAATQTAAKKQSKKALGEALITHSSVRVSSSYSGVDRVVNYEFTHRDVPEAFEGFRIAFISDLHYQSLLKETGLKDLVRLLIAQKADVLLMGGDYQEGCEYVDPLFKALAGVQTPLGTYGVMGNNDYERCHDEIVQSMQHYGMHVLEHKVDTLHKGGQYILLAGVRDPFDLTRNGESPTLGLTADDFVILLVHTPDYIEQVPVTHTDLALAGHTHGGQVRMFGIAPVLNSHYGTRFLTGLAYNSENIPIIVTNGIGTSRMPIRMGAPAEVIIITLHRLTE